MVTTAPRSPLRSSTAPRTRWSRLRRAAAASVMVGALALAGCTGGAAEPESTAAPSAATAEPSTASAAATLTPTPTATAPSRSVPEAEAAAAGEAAYRANTLEGFRHLDTALREAAAGHPGVYIRTPELDAILQAVATDPDYNARANEPAVVLQDAPSASGSAGTPVVTKVRVDTVELYDTPQSIDDQVGITGKVTLSACTDVTSLRTLGPGGELLFPDATTPRVLRETVTVRQQPQFITGVVGWYVAERTNTVEQSCDLP